ncbi:hypothetical protein [Leptospira interrogans]|nr:hypothetical protein [Leptospira interrogans]
MCVFEPRTAIHRKPVSDSKILFQLVGLVMALSVYLGNSNKHTS